MQWERLLQHTEITLNLFQISHMILNLSAYASICGNSNFNQTPYAPHGTKIAVHIKPDKRKSWGYNVELGYYVIPVLEHYRCFKCYIPATCGM